MESLNQYLLSDPSLQPVIDATASCITGRECQRIVNKNNDYQITKPTTHFRTFSFAFPLLYVYHCLANLCELYISCGEYTTFSQAKSF